MDGNASAVVVIFYKGQEHTIRFSNLKIIKMESEVGEQMSFDDFTAACATGTKSLTLTGEMGDQRMSPDEFEMLLGPMPHSKPAP